MTTEDRTLCKMLVKEPLWTMDFVCPTCGHKSLLRESILSGKASPSAVKVELSFDGEFLYQDDNSFGRSEYYAGFSPFEDRSLRNFLCAGCFEKVPLLKQTEGSVKRWMKKEGMIRVLPLMELLSISKGDLLSADLQERIFLKLERSTHHETKKVETVLSILVRDFDGSMKWKSSHRYISSLLTQLPKLAKSCRWAISCYNDQLTAEECLRESLKHPGAEMIEEAVRAALYKILPQGSGIDCEWQFAVLKNGKVQIFNEWHLMNDLGYYMGYIPFRATLFWNKTTCRIDFKRVMCAHVDTRYYLEELLDSCFSHECLGSGPPVSVTDEDAIF